MTQNDLAEIAECKDASLTCCHEYHVIPEETCSSYASDGYKCVDQSKCLDTLFDATSALTGIRKETDESSNPKLASCDDSSEGKSLNIVVIIRNGLIKTKSISL